MNPEIVSGEQAPPAKRLVWTQIAEVGAWKGHPAGPFELNESVFSEIVANFKRDGLLVPIDAEHASEMDPTSGSIPTHGVPAMGWIHQLDNRGKLGLWGLVEWLEPAATYIKEGRYRYLSPSVRFGARCRVSGNPTGAKLSSAAITNNPFLKTLKPLAATDRDDNAPALTLADYLHAPGEYMPAIRAALKLPDDADAEAVIARVHQLEKLTAVNDADLEVAGQSVRAHLTALGAALNMPMGTETTEMLRVAKRLVRAAKQTQGAIAASETKENTTMDQAKLLSDAQAQVSELTLRMTASETRATQLEAENKKLRDELATRESRELEGEVDEVIAVYADSKGATKEMRPHLMSMAKTAPDAFRAMYPRVAPDKRHILQNLSATGPGTQQQTQAVSMNDRIEQIRAERKCDFGTAQNLAFKERNNVRSFGRGGR